MNEIDDIEIIEDCKITDQNRQLPPVKYEYLDHTADIQIHSWGDTLEEAFEQSAVAMFGYMTEIDTVNIIGSHEIEVEADDLESLLYQFLNEFLFMFCAEPFFVARKVEIVTYEPERFYMKARAFGEPFDLDKHPQGTEVKAITYSNMQIHSNDGKHEVFVIVDI